MSAPPDLDGLIDALAERALAGEAIDPREEARRCPEHAGELGPIAAALNRLVEAGGPAGLRAGDQLRGFRIVRRIGQGGMGVVFEAEQQALGRRVALKVLWGAAAADEVGRLRFGREACAAASLRHPHIVPVFGYDAEARPPFLVMELVEGTSLPRILRAARAAGAGAGGRLRALLAGEPPEEPASTGAEEAPAEASRTTLLRPPAAAGGPAPAAAEGARLGGDAARAVARLALQAAEALAYTHEEGVVHRDITPANLMIDRSGRLRIIDFGLARLAADAGPSLTRQPVGTPRYMSPEQVDPRRGPIGGWSDVYSLGVTLYELLTLRPAFPDDTYERTLERVKVEEPTPLRRLNPGVPRDLATIVEKAMAKDLAHRFSGAAAMAEELRLFLAGRPLTIRPVSRLDRVARWAGRHRGELASAAAVALVATGLTIGLLLQSNRAMRRQRDQASSLARTLGESLRESVVSLTALTRLVPLGDDPTHRALLELVARFDRAMDQVPGGVQDPTLLRAAGLARLELARSFRERGRVVHRPQVLHHLDRAIELLGKASSRRPGLIPARRDLVLALIERGSVHLTDPSFYGPQEPADEAARGAALGRWEADARRGMDLARGLAADYPDRPEGADLLAYQHCHAIAGLQALGRVDEAENHAREALRIATGLSRSGGPQRTVFLQNVFRARTALGSLAHKARRFGDAAREYREALDVHSELALSGPYQLNYPEEHATLQRVLARCLCDAGQYGDAEALLDKAFDTAERYARLYPRNERYAAGPYEIRTELGYLSFAAGRFEEARECYVRLIADLETLLEADPPPSYPVATLADIYDACPLPDLCNPERAKKLRTGTGAD